jgi:hypothetical protein
MSGRHRAPQSEGRWTRGNTAGRRRVALVVATVLGMGSLAATGSWAAWTVTDANSGNTFTSSTVLLGDNQGGQGGSAVTSGTAMFNVTNLSPGSTSTTACIGVNLSGATPASLTLGAALGGAGQSTLQTELTVNTATYNTSGTVTVTPGSNTNNGSCASYPAGGTNTTIGTQGATLQTWAAGGPYSIASPVTNTWYKFTISGLPAGDSNCVTYCGKTITVALTWTLVTT